MSVATVAGAVSARLAPHRAVVTNSASLAATTLLTAGLGVVYWAVAAHLLPQHEVGVASAVLSAMTLAGTVGMLGLGSLLIAELPGRERRAGAHLISTALAATAVVGGIVGVLWEAGLQFSAELGPATRQPLTAVFFVLGCAATSLTLTFDQATIGLLAGTLQTWRNTVQGVLKLAAVPVCIAVAGHGAGATALSVSWVGGTVLSVPAAALIARRRGLALWARPQLSLLRALRRQTTDHSMLTIALTAPRLAMPLVIATVVSAAANASFYIAWMIASMLYLIPGHLSTVLFAVGKGDRAQLRSKMQFTLGISVAIGVPASVGVIALAHPLLGLFGATYASSGSTCLVLLALAFPANVVKQHYVAVKRVDDQLRAAWHLMAAMCVAELAVVAVTGAHWGVTAATAGLLVVMCVEGALTGPAVWRTLRPAR